MTGPSTSGTTHPSANTLRRNLGFAVFLAAITGSYLAPLRELIRLSLSDDTYSHILLVPFLTGGLVWMNRDAIMRRGGSSPRPAAICLFAGVLLYTLRARLDSLASGAALLTITILSAVVLIWAGFLFFYGGAAFRAALFPLMFLLLAVPIPTPAVDQLILWLQQGSSEVTYWLFRATGTPVFRSGFLFSVPGQTIEIAQECSGIRSSLAMLVTCLMAGYLFLRAGWARVVLLVAAVPMLVIKNGIRIVTLTLLSIHVDPGFLHGKLHHDGGFVFFILGLIILWPLLRWLQRVETRTLAPENARPASGSALASHTG